MSDAFLRPFIRRFSAPDTGMHIGTVSAIDVGDNSVTVLLGGEAIPGMRWLASYSPVVADIVVVSRVQTMWVVLDKLSTQFGAPTVLYGSVAITPTAVFAGVDAEDLWSWTVSADGSGVQGSRTLYGVYEVHAGVWALPVAGSLPPGATVMTAKLTATRWAVPPEGVGVTPELPLVSPVFRMHGYTSAPSSDPGWTGAPVWIGDPWMPGQLLSGQSALWDLPSAWLTALLAGTARGVAVSSPAAADYSRFYYVRIDLTYSMPA